MEPKEQSYRALAPAAADVLDERHRQIYEEGWTAEHDDQWAHGELAAAAGCYALHVCLTVRGRALMGPVPTPWPWDPSWWKPKDTRRDLVRAAALLLAEIERLDRKDDK